MRRRGSPWPVRSVIAGAAGTAAMTLAYATEHRLRPQVQGALDYDDSLIPGKIVANVLRLGDVTDTEDAELKAALKWGYGSAFGLWHGTLRRFLPEPWASARVRRDAHDVRPSVCSRCSAERLHRGDGNPDVLATSVGTHVAYVLGVALVDDVLRADRDDRR